MLFKCYSKNININLRVWRYWNVSTLLCLQWLLRWTRWTAINEPKSIRDNWLVIQFFGSSVLFNIQGNYLIYLEKKGGGDSMTKWLRPLSFDQKNWGSIPCRNPLCYCHRGNSYSQIHAYEVYLYCLSSYLWDELSFKATNHNRVIFEGGISYLNLVWKFIVLKDLDLSGNFESIINDFF